mgnify:CR=1 FL=1
MKKYLPFIILAGGGALLYFSSIASAGRKIKVYFSSLKFGKIKGFNVPDTFAIFRLVNPTNTSITLNSFQADLFINDKYFGNMQNLNTTIIPANSEVNYSIKIEISVISTAMAFINLFRSGKKVKISYKGTINSAGLVIPISETVYQ